MAIHLATNFCGDDAMRVLLDRNADIESRTASYYTPLHVAVSWPECDPRSGRVQFFEVGELQYLGHYVL